MSDNISLWDVVDNNDSNFAFIHNINEIMGVLVMYLSPFSVCIHVYV